MESARLKRPTRVAATALEEVMAYRATNGTVFTNKAEAEHYQANLDFYNWYEGLQNGKLYGCDSQIHDVDAGQLLEWLRKHKEVLLPMILERESS